MTLKAGTELILITTILGLIGWDIYVAVAPPAGDTISEIILATARKHPIIPFALGVLMGHLFWSQR